MRITITPSENQSSIACGQHPAVAVEIPDDNCDAEDFAGLLLSAGYAWGFIPSALNAALAQKITPSS